VSKIFATLAGGDTTRCRNTYRHNVGCSDSVSPSPT
jgi:hypothetical protein